MNQRQRRDQALKEAIESHQGPLTSVIRGMVRDQVEAEDVLQDVFAEFIAAYDLGLTFERLGSWLAKVAKNKIIDRFRRKKTQTDYVQSQGPALLESPNDERVRSWLRDEILAALELLPPEQRQVFVMYELEGKSFKEIAAETRVPLGTLLARKKYAVDFLRDQLREIYDEYD